jgi:hypothetical protein
LFLAFAAGHEAASKKGLRNCPDAVPAASGTTRGGEDAVAFLEDAPIHITTTSELADAIREAFVNCDHMEPRKA